MMRRAGWIFFGVSSAMVLISIVLQALSRYTINFVFNIGESFLLIVFALVGAIILSRTANSVGWIFALIPLFVGVERLAGAYCMFQIFRGGACSDLPLWITGTFWPSGISIVLMVGFLPLLFPTGRFLSPKWMKVGLIVAMVSLTYMFFNAFLLQDFEEPLKGFSNPFGIAALERAKIVFNILEPSLIAMLGVGLASLGVRLRRSRGHERQQMKWFVFSIGALLLVFVLGAIGEALDPAGLVDERVGGVLFLMAAMGIPVSVGIAITRYRLYDIDRLINRTIVYIVITVFLVTLYVGLVISLQGVLRPTTASSDLAIVASTLGVAAMFNPLRRRVQGFVDRLFYRRKYDAQRTLEGFGQMLRDDIDLENISDELVRVVDRTIRPATVYLWLSGESQ